uniref:CSON009668 protein n=1 Tax=Culicoides sonorensis TaxID=179676 RepID=A0A336M192_CULSO
MEEKTSIIKQFMRKLDFTSINFYINHTNEEESVTFLEKEKKAEIIIHSYDLETDIHFMMQVVLINHRTDIVIHYGTQTWEFDGSRSLNRHFANIFHIEPSLISTFNAGEFPEPEVYCTYIEPHNSVSEYQVHHQNIRLLTVNGEVCDDPDLLEWIDQNFSQITHKYFTYFIEITCSDLIRQKQAILENISRCCRAIVGDFIILLKSRFLPLYGKGIVDESPDQFQAISISNGHDTEKNVIDLTLALPDETGTENHAIKSTTDDIVETCSKIYSQEELILDNNQPSKFEKLLNGLWNCDKWPIEEIKVNMQQMERETDMISKYIPKEGLARKFWEANPPKHTKKNMMVKIERLPKMSNQSVKNFYKNKDIETSSVPSEYSSFKNGSIINSTVVEALRKDDKGTDNSIQKKTYFNNLNNNDNLNNSWYIIDSEDEEGTTLKRKSQETHGNSVSKFFKNEELRQQRQSLKSNAMKKPANPKPKSKPSKPHFSSKPKKPRALVIIAEGPDKITTHYKTVPLKSHLNQINDTQESMFYDLQKASRDRAAKHESVKRIVAERRNNPYFSSNELSRGARMCQLANIQASLPKPRSFQKTVPQNVTSKVIEVHDSPEKSEPMEVDQMDKDALWTRRDYRPSLEKFDVPLNFSNNLRQKEEINFDLMNFE